MSRRRPRTRLPRSVPVGQMRRNLRAVQRFRMNFVFGTLLVIFLVLLGRVGKLQIVDAAMWKAKAARVQQGQVSFRGLRGRILDTRGRTLVTSRRVLSVAVDLVAVREQEDLGQGPGVRIFSERLARLLDERDGGRAIYRRLRKVDPCCRHVTLRNRIVDARIVQVLLGYANNSTATANAGLAGLKICAGEERRYPNGKDYARDVLGQVAEPMRARTCEGMERTLDAALTSGTVSVAYHRGYRRPLAALAVDPLEARGRDIRLTLDIVIQHFAETALDKAMAPWKATEGTVIVLDPQTGHILALANRQPRGINLALRAPWAPGSILKPLVVARGLDGGFTTPDENFDLPQGMDFHWRRGSRQVHDDHHVGQGTVIEILSQSSNVGAAQIFWRSLRGPRWREPAAEATYARAEAFLRDLGFYGPCGIELHTLDEEGHERPAERIDPFILDKTPNPLYPALGYAFGKGFGVPPLKLLCAFAALARKDRRIVRPTLLPGRGGGRVGLPPVCRRREDQLVVQEGLRAAATHGTARQVFAGCPFDVCAKTGTAVYEGTSRRIAGLAAFAPLPDPRLAVLVMIHVDKETVHDDGETHPAYGATVSGPAVRRILERSLAYLDGRGLEEAKRLGALK